MLCRLCHQIDNVMEDIYVNALQRQMLGGLYAQGINLGNQMIAEDAISINEQKNENYPDFIIVINCLLTLLKANAVYYGKHEAEYKPRVQAIYRIARQHIFRHRAAAYFQAVAHGTLRRYQSDDVRAVGLC